MRHSALFVSAVLCLLAAPSLAQYNAYPQDNYPQDNAYPADNSAGEYEQPPAIAGGGGSVAPSGAAQLQVEISQIADEMRSLRGRLEEIEFQLHKIQDEQSKFEHDTDYRLNALEQARPPAAAENPAPAPAAETAPPPSSKGNAAKAQAPAEEAPQSFSSPREHYNYAFRLINQTRYDDAAKSFKSFIDSYPKDPLIGNAYYWLGETYYIRRDYVKAADSFRAGFEALPGGPKAADNLFKLALSLSAMKNMHDACVVLEQLRVKFKDRAPSTVQKAEAERMRLGCQ